MSVVCKFCDKKVGNLFFRVSVKRGWEVICFDCSEAIANFVSEIKMFVEIGSEEMKAKYQVTGIELCMDGSLNAIKVMLVGNSNIKKVFHVSQDGVESYHEGSNGVAPVRFEDLEPLTELYERYSVAIGEIKSSIEVKNAKGSGKTGETES